LKEEGVDEDENAYEAYVSHFLLILFALCSRQAVAGEKSSYSSGERALWQILAFWHFRV